MGHSEYPLAHPLHPVTLSGYWIGRFEVTNREYDLFRKRPRYPESPGPNHPATRVGWTDATAFCRWLSRREGRTYRLPTEAEWEYAARGGLDQRDYPWGDEPPDGRAQISVLTTAPVGSFPPNGYGLFDMAGNVTEWVADRWQPAEEMPDGASRYYEVSPVLNPKGPATGYERVIRDGSYDTWEVQCYARLLDDPKNSIPERGFRIAMDERSPSPRKPQVKRQP